MSNFIDMQHKLILLLDKCRGSMTSVVVMFPEEDIENRLIPCIKDIDEMTQELLKS
jgi:hypothetical protein